MDIQSYTVKEFCSAFRISRSFFYKLKKQGQAPQTYKLGTRTFVSAKAVNEWRENVQISMKN